MATRTLYVTKDMKDPIYRTRRLKAGDALELDGPTSRLYLHLGLVTEQKPRRAAEVVVETAEAPKPARKRTARRKK